MWLKGMWTNICVSKFSLLWFSHTWIKYKGRPQAECAGSHYCSENFGRPHILEIYLKTSKQLWYSHNEGAIRREQELFLSYLYFGNVHSKVNSSGLWSVFTMGSYKLWFPFKTGATSCFSLSLHMKCKVDSNLPENSPTQYRDWKVQGTSHRDSVSLKEPVSVFPTTQGSRVISWIGAFSLALGKVRCVSGAEQRDFCGPH